MSTKHKIKSPSPPTDQTESRVMTTPSTPETVPVNLEVIGVEAVRDRGALVGLAIVELDVAGVVMTLQGVQVVQTAAGIAVRSAVFRHPKSGKWLPGVLLPPELASAIAAEVVPMLSPR